MTITFDGNDNSGWPRQFYADGLATLTDVQLAKECKDKIWLSAFANNNPRSDYHWQVDACYDECRARGKIAIYEAAHKAVREMAG